MALGITMGMTEDELVAALEGVDYELDSEGSNYFNYYEIEIEEYRSYYTILVNKEEKVVTSIEVEAE